MPSQIPWDPHWRAHDGTQVLEDGPGHLVVWGEEGCNELGWRVPHRVAVAAIVTTAAAATGHNSRRLKK